MGKVYGKNASGSTQLIIDGDAIDQRLSTLEANWDSISRIEYGNVTTGQVGAHTRISTTVEFEKSYSEAPEVFIQDVSPGGNVSDAINNKTIVFNVSTTGFTASSFNNTGSNFDNMNFFWLAIGK